MAKPKFEMDHVAIAVSDLDRSMKWYSSVFGFETKAKFDRPDLKVKGAIMALGQYKLELFGPYEPEPMEEYRKRLETSLQVVGAQHFALSVDDVVQAQKYLRQQGVECQDITEGKTAKYLFCKDLDGILIEVKQNLG